MGCLTYWLGPPSAGRNDAPPRFLTTRVSALKSASPDTAEVDALLGLQYLRNHGLPPHTLYGNKALYADRSALLLQVTAAAAAVASWTLCEQMVVVSPTLALVKTDADPAMWRTHMDRALQEDPTVAALQLKFKASWEGGRTFVVPTATPAQMAATRRTRGKYPAETQPHHLATEVSICGATGYDPLQAVTVLMRVVAQKTGITLQNASLEDVAPAGTWRWLAATDPTAPPGRVRLQLASMEQVRAVHESVHNRSIEIGVDLVAIAVQNDLLDIAGLGPGNGRGGPRQARS